MLELYPDRRAGELCASVVEADNIKLLFSPQIKFHFLRRRLKVFSLLFPCVRPPVCPYVSMTFVCISGRACAFSQICSPSDENGKIIDLKEMMAGSELMTMLSVLPSKTLSSPL